MLEVLPVAVAEHKHVPLKSCATVAVRSINKLAVSPYQPALSVLEPKLFSWSCSGTGPVEDHCQLGWCPLLALTAPLSLTRASI
ncbi:hypothetical protein HaLaN_09937 [Haematococcus lacustris]|uniref:Uncharacterized protein n=1 Tax=Haematococcus lacustris TaxID=44745 RepID=A0A699YUQ2_HAELA|nr:hypothetical protein HaLaN_09937 [Haematococcus lacustris]